MASIAKRPGIQRINLTSVPTAHHFVNFEKTERPQNESIKKEEETHPTESVVS